VGGEIASMIYYCYQFGFSARFVTKNRLALFSDFYDFYSSFLFNLMSRSPSIKNIALNINQYVADETIEGRGALMAGEIAKIVRLILDF
jgi:hypothetical protein